jgi:hypothetical protein
LLAALIIHLELGHLSLLERVARAKQRSNRPWPYLARSSICAQADHLMRWQWDVCTAANGMTSLRADWTNRRGELPESPQARAQICPKNFFGIPSEQKPFSLLNGACAHPIQIHRLHLRAIWFGACHRWPSRIDRQICKNRLFRTLDSLGQECPAPLTARSAN